MARRVGAAAGLYKIGSQLFTAEGPRAVENVAALTEGVFLDLKFHDIPNTVAKAVAAACRLPKVRLLTLHASGGKAMMQAARESAERKKDRPSLLAVTVLTSLDGEALRSVGMAGSPEALAPALAILAKESGLDGVVASAYEVRSIRAACGPEFLIVVPGIRPASGTLNDQARVASPEEAIRAGANYLVVGRPITGADDPQKAALSIAQEMEGATEPEAGELRKSAENSN